MTLDFEAMRNAMVKEQLAARDITDTRTLEAMRKVPREKFVDPADVSRAYGDFAMAIGMGQTISQPYIVALMTQELGLPVLRSELLRRVVTGEEKVLEIGTGSGYQTAILAEMSAYVYTVERLAELSEHAARTLGELGYHNVYFRVGDGSLGWPEEAPFQRVIVTAAAPRIPPPLEAQLAEGGILVIPVGDEGFQKLLVARKIKGKLESRSVCECVFVKLVGEAGWPG